MKHDAKHRRDFLKHSVATAGAAALGLPLSALGQRAKVFRFGHMLPADTLYNKAIQMFADEANKLSSGRLKVDIYPASQLGTTALGFEARARADEPAPLERVQVIPLHGRPDKKLDHMTLDAKRTWDEMIERSALLTWLLY